MDEYQTPQAIKVLVVDDDQDYFNLIATYLKHSNNSIDYTVEWASGYQKGREALCTQSHDTYLVNYRLSDTHNGFDLLKTAMEFQNTAPILIMTDSESHQIDSVALELGAAGMIYKPDLTPRTLDQLIRYGLKRSELNQELLDTQLQLRSLAHIDPLTRLPNRTAVLYEIKKVIEDATRQNRHGAVLFVDLDDFKPVNDNHGHNAGDKVLVEVASRLKASLRRTDVVGRLGGDEFVVVMPDLPQDTNLENMISIVTDKIIKSISKPFIIQDEDESKVSNLANVSASIGVAVFPLDGRTPQRLLKRADAAMYQAKAAGKNTVRFYSLSRNGEPSQNASDSDA